MPTTLHSATVPLLRQMLGSLTGLIDKAEAHCREKGLAPEALIQARLAPDMHPFAYQIKAVAFTAAGGLRAAIDGEFRPDMNPPPESFADLRSRVADADAVLAALPADGLNAAEGGDATIIVGDMRIPFTAENFVTSFVLPNALFHASIAYAILRNQGLAVGKTDFLGKMALKV